MSSTQDFTVKFNEISPLPHVVSSVTQLINDPESTMRAFEEVIQTDPVLVSRLLQLVNSSFYGLNQKVDSIGRAVAFLGMKNLHNLIVTDAIKKIFTASSPSPSGFSKQALWTHCSTVSICSKMVSERIFSINGDDAFLCGILHDFGLIVEEQLRPEEFGDICSSSKSTSSLIEMEEKIFGTNHCKICHTMALEWNMPATIQEAILIHHQTEEEVEPTSLTGILQISEYIADQLEHPELPEIKTEISPNLLTHLQDNLDEYTLLIEDLPEEIEKAQAVYQ